MSTPEQKPVDGIIPAAPGWRVVYRYRGVSSGRVFATPDDCFASDGICRRIYARQPLDQYAYHYRPLTNAQSADSPDLPNRDCDDADASSDRDDISGSADPGCEPLAAGLLPDDGDTRDAEGLLLANTHANAGAGPDVQGMRDADSRGVLRKEGVLT